MAIGDETVQLFYYLCFALAGCFYLPAMKSLQSFIVILQKRFVPACWIFLLPVITPANLLSMNRGFRLEFGTLTPIVLTKKFINKRKGDIVPDYQNNTLTVKLYTMSTLRENAAVSKMCTLLNDTETLFPGTNLRLIFEFATT
ncbi:MAG TPA: hypothetical protein ENN08_02185 [Bacteroidales bacterium]|nr:hypothetical protein [Bacteroidales bacterium]